jgi:hypothetical protein
MFIPDCSLDVLSHQKSAKIYKIVSFSILWFIVFCTINLPTCYSYGEDLPTTPSIYIFKSGECTLGQQGGSPFISESYKLNGNFTISLMYGYTSFWDVNSTFTPASSKLYTQEFEELFNLYSLDSTVTDNYTITFTGKTSDGTNSDVLLVLSFSGDLVTMTGTITPVNPNDYSYTLYAVAVRKYGGGLGDSYYPYLIKTPVHMNTIGLNQGDWGNYFQLATNINMSGYKNKEYHIIGYYNSPTDNKPFTGVFLGNNRTISGFNYKASNVNRIGLFGYINGTNAQITKLGIVDPNISASGGEYIGSLVGQLVNGTITSCYVSGGNIVGTNMVGGLAGRNGYCLPVTDIEDNTCQAGTMISCRSSASVSGVNGVGDLIGSNDGAVISCITSGAVTGDSDIGGLAGFNGFTITDCNSTTTVSGIWRAGGMVGNNYGIICDSYTSGAISGQESVGGLTGDNNGGYINVCHSSSTVNGFSIVGGISGTNGGNITISYSTGTVTGDLYVGGLVGLNQHCISSCYSSGIVSVQYGYAGGLVGINDSAGSIFNSYASGSATGGSFIGGLLGSNDGVVMKCYSYASVTGLGGLGGLVGDATDKACTLFSFWDTQKSGQSLSSGGKGKTTGQMKLLITYENWDKGSGDTVWTINDGKDYPRLLWENKDGTEIEILPLTDFITGTGRVDNPFLIYTPQQLKLIGLFPAEWDKHYKLRSNINMSTDTVTPYNIIGYYRIPFTGVFDGNNCTISNLKLNIVDQNYVGLFGCVGSLIASVKNVGLIKPDINARDKDYVAPLIGYLKIGSVSNCYTSDVNIIGQNSVSALVGYNQGTITGSYSSGIVSAIRAAGGLAGSSYRGTISGSHSNIIVIGDSEAGGIAGNNTGTITDSYSSGMVSANGLAGGIAGYSTAAITSSYSSALITGYDKIGGLVGSNKGPLTNCYATGNISGDDSSGGLVGYNAKASITSCHATGDVYSRISAGGLVGYNTQGASIINCYSQNSVAGYQWVGGLTGKNEASISKSYFSGGVSGSLEVGGLAGWNLSSGSIANSYAQGSILAVQWAGGLVGNNIGSITKSYSSCGVSGTSGTVGGLAGMNFGSVSAAFWDIQTSGQASSAGGTGKTTAQMKTKSTYTSAGWDFVGETANGTQDIWRILENQDYPRLNWQP